MPFDSRGAGWRSSQPADGLHPPKHFFDEFPFALADRVAGVARGASIDRTALRRCATCGVTPSCRAISTKGRVSYALSAPTVTAPGGKRANSPVAASRSARAGRGRHARVDDQAVAILDQHVAEIAELRFFPARLCDRAASGSVVEAWVAFERFSPRKLTVGLPGSSSGVDGGAIAPVESSSASPTPPAACRRR